MHSTSKEWHAWALKLTSLEQQPWPTRLGIIWHPSTSWTWYSLCSSTRAWYAQLWNMLTLAAASKNALQGDYECPLPCHGTFPQHKRQGMPQKTCNTEPSTVEMEHRWKQGDMIDVYQYLHDIYKVSNPCFELSQGREARGNSLKVPKSRCRFNIRSSFSERVVTTWSSLPGLVVIAPSADSFRRQLDTHLPDLPSISDPRCYLEWWTVPNQLHQTGIGTITHNSIVTADLCNTQGRCIKYAYLTHFYQMKARKTFLKN